MAEWQWVKDSREYIKERAHDAADGLGELADDTIDGTKNLVHSWAEWVRSFVDDIRLTDDEMRLLETHPSLQLGNEVFDGRLSPDDQKHLIQKVLQMKSRRDINALLSQIKTAELRLLVQSYAIPDHEEGTELDPSTGEEDVSMFVDSALKPVTAIRKSTVNMTRWGETPDERVDNLQAEVIMQAKRTRLAVHNMIAESPEWLQMGSPSHDSSGWVDPYLPWNSIRDEDSRTLTGQEEIIENTPEHKLDYLESIIGTMVDVARNPKNLDSDLNPRNASISIPSTTIGSTERKFDSNYENELQFALQFLQAMEEGAKAENRGILMSVLNYHITSPLAAVSWDLVGIALVAVGSVKLFGGAFKDNLKSVAAKKIWWLRIPMLGDAINLAESYMRHKAASFWGGASATDGATEVDMKTVEGVKVPKDIAEELESALRKLTESKDTEAIFDTVEIDENAVATRQEKVTLTKEEMRLRVTYIRSQLKKFANGKINGNELLESVRMGYDGRYRYVTTVGLLEWVGGTTGNVAKIKKVGTNIKDRLQRKTIEKLGLGGNLESDITGKALRGSDEYEPYTFEDDEWKLTNAKESREILVKLETLLIQRDRLHKVKQLLGTVKDKKLALESIQHDISVAETKGDLKDTHPILSVTPGVPHTSAESTKERQSLLNLQEQKVQAMNELQKALESVRESGIQVDGIANLNKLNWKSDIWFIEKLISNIDAKLTQGWWIYKTIEVQLADLKSKNTWATHIPTFEELREKPADAGMKALLRGVGNKIKVKL